MSRSRKQPTIINGKEYFACSYCGMLKPPSGFSRIKYATYTATASYCKECRAKIARQKTIERYKAHYGITEEQANEMDANFRERRNGKGANICFDCKNACGGCSWTRCDTDRKGKPIMFQPVDGWTAEKIYRRDVNGHIMATYSITACPEFVPDERRNEWKD